MSFFLHVHHSPTDSTKGQVRLLKYAKESKNLFFTTTLQNSVQSYSLRYSKLLDPTHVHPSPPSVFALSCTSRFLVSTSPAPPTIHLTSLALSTPPVLLRPQFSSSAVVAAEFHPERENYFCLAFADGTAALYDANHFYDSHGNGKRRKNAAIIGTGGEKAFIRGLHIGSLTKNAATEDGVTAKGYDTGTAPSGIGLRESGISAVAFVPRRKATVVTIGADGRCCVVDFTQPTKQKAVLLKSWHIRRPATSLSILCSTKKAGIGQFDGDDNEPTKRQDLPNESYYIAVGRSDGRVLLFDLDGKARGEQALDDKSARVIDVEWTQIGSDTVLPHHDIGSDTRRSPVAKSKQKSLASSAIAESRPSHMESQTMFSYTPDHFDDPLFDFSTPRKTLGAFHWERPSNESTVAATIPRDGVRENSMIVQEKPSNNDIQQKPTHATTTSSSATVQRNPIEISSYTESEESSSFRSSTEDGSTPPIPPRPSPKPGGRLSMRRAQTSRQPDIQSTSYLSMMAKARKMSASNPRLSKGVSVANAPTKTKVLFGPRKPPSPKMNYLQDNTKLTAQNMSEQPEDAWLDVPPETPRRATELSPVSSATSNKSYKTAVSHLYSSDSPERSDDTVVDWTVGLPRQPVPTFHITYPSGERPSKSNKKGHISLSVSSESAHAPTSTASTSGITASPISRSPVGSPPKMPLSLPSTRSTEPEVKQKAEPKQKGHVSLSASSATDSNTITPISSGSDGPIVQRPSLKKSPRIPELNKGLQELSSRNGSIVDSVTGTVLQNYTDFLSPSPTRATNTSRLVSTIHPERKAPSQSPPKVAPKPVLDSPVDLERDPQPRSCTCSLTIKSILDASLSTLRAEITQNFEAQKPWFEELLRAKEEGRMTLAEENRWLRGELAISKKEKEKEKEEGNGKSKPT